MAINHILHSFTSPIVTTSELTSLLRTLHDGTNPLTGEMRASGSCLLEDDVQNGLSYLIRKLDERQTAAATISEAEIATCCSDLRELGYVPTMNQVAKVFIGSRSIVDPRLRAVPSYKKYRGVFTRRAIRDLLGRYEELIEGSRQLLASRDDGWRAVDFFDTGAFDKLSDSKATELYREVQQLGLHKVTEHLPAYMARARTQVPRAFEPWTREEKALLVEAMCYTNDSEKLASIFGRSKSAIRQEGKRLIWNSQQKVA